MNKRIVAVLIGFCCIALAVLTTQLNRPKPDPEVGKPLLATFDATAVGSVESGGRQIVVLGSSGWVVPALQGYPADRVKLREFLLGLIELKIGYVARGKKLADGIPLELKNADGKTLAALTLGEKKFRAPTDEAAMMYGGGPVASGRYVARTGSDTVYFVANPLENADGSDPKAWVDTQILKVDAAELVKYELASGGKTLVLNRKDGGLALEGLAVGEEMNPSGLYGLESALSHLRFTGIADAALTPEQAGFATGAVYKATAKNGTVYTAQIGNPADGGRYARFVSSGTNNVANAELARWTYIVSPENFIKTREELVKAKEPPAQEKEKK